MQQRGVPCTRVFALRANREVLPSHLWMDTRATFRISSEFPFRISSNEFFFARELDFLKVFFKKNSFPHQVVQELFKKSLQKIKNPKPQCSTVERKPVFINLPYLGKDSSIIKRARGLMMPSLGERGESRPLGGEVRGRTMKWSRWGP